MELDNDLITQFAKFTQFEPKEKDSTTVRGTVHVSEGRNYIHLDGADKGSTTPVETTVELNEGDRVIAISKDHSIIVTGNETNPSVGTVTAGNLRSTIEQTAGAITTRVELLEGDNAKFTEFKQTIEGFTFEDEDGNVKIDGGNVELTGAITWSDLSSGTQSAINNAQTTANNAQSTASSALNIANSIDIPDYIKSTYIDFTTVASPSIIGGTFYAVGSDPNQKSTFFTMTEKGFDLYSNATVPDINGKVYPKVSLFCNDDGYASPSIIFGSGVADDMEFANRFEIYKGPTSVNMTLYATDVMPGSSIYLGLNGTITMRGNVSTSPYYDDGKETGGNLDVAGDLTVGGELRGTGGLFPIGYIYLSLDSTSPATLFGGTWEQLRAVYLYATSDYSELGAIYKNVLIDVQHEGAVVNHAQLIKIAAWRRVS